MDSERLWPAHPHPHTGELLSSWLVRVAHANGLKVQTFCRLAFGNDRQVWNRDIDRLAPAWLIETMSTRTGTPIRRAWQTTLMVYGGKLYARGKAAGQLQWVLSLKMYHRKRRGYGLQFCPRCLAADAEPYFRLAWRVAFYTFCPKHHCMLLDRCPQCGQGVAYHRIELGRPDITSADPLCRCWMCGYDYRQSGTTTVDKWSERTFESWTKALRMIDCGAPSSTRFDYGKLAVLHQMVKLLNGDEKNRRLARYVASRTGQVVPNAAATRVPIEGRGLVERHHVVGLAWWLIGRWPTRLRAAWRCRALRYNWLLRDFKRAPDWYWAFANSLLWRAVGRQKHSTHDGHNGASRRSLSIRGKGDATTGQA